MQTLSQKYAAKAYERVIDITKQDEKYQKKYGTMAHKLPILVHTAGLVQALAFVAAKGSGEKSGAWRQYLEDIAKTVDAQLDAEALLVESQKAGLNEYIWLTRRVSRAALWYKRFAESILKVEASEQMDETANEESET